MSSNSKQKNQKRPIPYKTTVKRAKIAGILCLALIAVTLFLMSPVFKIKNIDVSGNIKLEKDDIISISGIDTGDNIFSVNDKKVNDNVKRLGKISSVQIVRTLPSKVTLVVDERTECGYIKEKGAYCAVDEKGTVIATQVSPNGEAPVIQGIKLKDIEIGQFMKIDSDNSKELSSLLTKILYELKAGDIISNIKTVDITDLKNIRMILTTDTLVNMGEDGEESGDTIEYKIAFLKAIIPELPDTQNGGVIELADTQNVTSRMS